MDVKYRIRKRTANGEEQYYVDYKRVGEEKPEWMGGFLVKSEEDARNFIKLHKEYEELKIRLQLTEDIIYDETGENEKR